MQKSRRIFNQTISHLYPVEKLTILFFLFSIALFALTKIPYHYFIAQLAQDLFKLSLFFLPAIALKFALDFTHVSRARSRQIFVPYFLFVMFLFLFSPLLGFKSSILGLIRLSSNFIYAGVFMFLVYIALSLRLLLKDPERHRIVIKDHLADLGILCRAAVLLILCFLIYSNLKAVIPLFRVYSWDSLAYKLDLGLCLGHNPYKILHAWLPTGEFTFFFHNVYFFFFYFNTIGFSGTLIFGSTRDLLELTHTVVLTFLIGLSLYWIVPTLGPFFANDTSYLFKGMMDEPYLKRQLMNTFQAVINSPHDFKIRPFSGIAAFPSLHVAHSLVFLYFLWSRQRLVAGLLVIPFFFLTLSTVYLGWHYIIDIPGGAVVAVAAIWIVHRKFRKYSEQKDGMIRTSRFFPETGSSSFSGNHRNTGAVLYSLKCNNASEQNLRP